MQDRDLTISASMCNMSPPHKNYSDIKLITAVNIPMKPISPPSLIRSLNEFFNSKSIKDISRH